MGRPSWPQGHSACHCYGTQRGDTRDPQGSRDQAATGNSRGRRSPWQLPQRNEEADPVRNREVVGRGGGGEDPQDLIRAFASGKTAESCRGGSVMDRRSFVKALLAGTAISAFGGSRYSRGAEFVLNARNAPKGGKVLIKGGSLITMDP